jgi:hypothetical protein
MTPTPQKPLLMGVFNLSKASSIELKLNGSDEVPDNPSFQKGNKQKPVFFLFVYLPFSVRENEIDTLKNVVCYIFCAVLCVRAISERSI